MKEENSSLSNLHDVQTTTGYDWQFSHMVNEVKDQNPD